MLCVYNPTDGDEQRIPFDINKMTMPEAIAIEKRTGMDFGEFGQRLAMKGSASAKLALLHVLLKRTHPGIRYEDLLANTSVGAIAVQFDDDELREMIAALEKRDDVEGAEKDKALAAMRGMLTDSAFTAIVEGDEPNPKASSSAVSTT